MLSLVIPTFKEGKIIKSSIKNILKLNRIDYEIIIIDDNSNDGTFEKVNRIADKLKYFNFYKPSQRDLVIPLRGIARSRITFVLRRDKSDDQKILYHITI